MLTNTQWVQAKSPADVTLEGVDVELDWNESTINSIIVRDAKGNALRILKGEYSGMKAMVPATVEKYVLKGTYGGLDFTGVYDDEAAAEERRRELTDLSGKVDLTIEKVRVPA